MPAHLVSVIWFLTFWLTVCILGQVLGMALGKLFEWAMRRWR